jgi:hypothetical protein
MKTRDPLAALAALALATAALGGDQPLARQSPFGAVAAEGSLGSPALELRGIMSGPEGARYCIFDRASQASAWAAPDEPGHPFLVRSGSPDGNWAAVEADGHLLVLRLKEARVLGAPAEAAGATEEAPHAIMTRRQPGEPRAPQPVHGP